MFSLIQKTDPCLSSPALSSPLLSPLLLSSSSPPPLPAPPPQMETRRRLAKIVLVFVGLFALCWFPNHVLYMYRSFHYEQPDVSLTHLLLTLLARVLSFSSSCVNPFALYLLSESFRRHFNRWVHMQSDTVPALHTRHSSTYYL